MPTRQVYHRACRSVDGAPCVRLHLDLVDGFRLIHRETGTVPLSPLCERLVTYLAVRGPSPRCYLAFRLWPDQPEEQSLSCLRTALWRLPQPGGDPLVQTAAAAVRLAEHVEVDVHRRYAEAGAWADTGAPPADLRVEGFAADILTGCYDDWALIERERFRQMRLHVLERLCTWHSREARFAEAIAAGLCAVDGGPLRESAHRRLVAVFLAEGNVEEALRQVKAYLANLDDAGLPRQLSPAMTELLTDDALSLLAARPPADAAPARARRRARAASSGAGG